MFACPYLGGERVAVLEPLRNVPPFRRRRRLDIRWVAGSYWPVEAVGRAEHHGSGDEAVLTPIDDGFPAVSPREPKCLGVNRPVGVLPDGEFPILDGRRLPGEIPGPDYRIRARAGPITPPHNRQAPSYVRHSAGSFGVVKEHQIVVQPRGRRESRLHDRRDRISGGEEVARRRLNGCRQYGQLHGSGIQPDISHRGRQNRRTGAVGTEPFLCQAERQG